MATLAAATSAPRPRKRRLVRKTLLGLLLLVVLAAAGILGWLYQVADSSLPQLDGTILVPGLHAPVTVARDAHGVPHLTAGSLEDLFLAQGYVTAQDRLWQMDMTRRYAGGELAEILPATKAPAPRTSRFTGHTRPSPTWLDLDKRQRILRLRSVSERVAAQLPARERSYFEAYGHGVNSYIEQHRDKLPVEFRILGYKPRPWTVADSVLVGVSMSQLLNPQYDMEYWREKIGAKLTPELMQDLYPAGSWRDRPPGSNAQDPKHDADVAQGGRTVTRDSGASQRTSDTTLDACESCLPGSNNWVVSGKHTVTGKPLLSNDMHLPHGVPGTWYEVHLHAGDFNVEGFSLPGLPFVVVGHNQNIAWGFTNLNPDVHCRRI
jgi:penicillin amidase